MYVPAINTIYQRGEACSLVKDSAETHDTIHSRVYYSAHIINIILWDKACSLIKGSVGMHDIPFKNMCPIVTVINVMY